MLTTALLYVFPGLMICAALWDLTTFEIPNWLSLALVLAFAALAVVAPIGAGEAFSRLGLGAAVLGVGILLFLKGLMGGGDIKLLAASAVWVGWSDFLFFLMVTAILGGLVALLVLAFRRLELPPSWASVGWLERLHTREQGLPYGVAIGAAGLLVFRQLPLP
jgi:prepilin peptidase CpaA